MLGRGLRALCPVRGAPRLWVAWPWGSGTRVSPRPAGEGLGHTALTSPHPPPCTRVSAAVDPGQEEILRFAKVPGEAGLPGTAGRGLAGGGGGGGPWAAGTVSELGGTADAPQETPGLRDRPSSAEESWEARRPQVEATALTGLPPGAELGPPAAKRLPLPQNRAEPPNPLLPGKNPRNQCHGVTSATANGAAGGGGVPKEEEWGTRGRCGVLSPGRVVALPPSCPWSCPGGP